MTEYNDVVEAVAEWLYMDYIALEYASHGIIIPRKDLKNGFKDEEDFLKNGYRDKARQLLSIKIDSLEVAVVDREAELPECQMENASERIRMIVGQLHEYYLHGKITEELYKDLTKSSGIIQADTEIFIYRGSQQDMLQAGYVKVVKHD